MATRGGSHRRRDPPVHIGVEDARHDVGGIQLIVSHHIGQGFGGSEQCRLSYLAECASRSPRKTPGKARTLLI